MQGHAQYLAFALGTAKWQLGFLVSLYLWGSRISPNCSCTVSLYLVVEREVCPSANTAVKGAGSQTVSLGLCLGASAGEMGMETRGSSFSFFCLASHSTSPKASHPCWHGMGHREGRIRGRGVKSLK